MKYNEEQIGKLLRQEREKRNMTQSKLASKLGVTNKQISNYERGEPIPPLDKLLDLCEIFDCELGYLIGEESYENETKLMTEFCKTTGLKQEAIESIIQTNTDLFHGDESRQVLNRMFTSSFFKAFIEDLIDVERVVSDYDTIDKGLNEKYSKESIDKAWEAYRDPYVDYEHDEEYQKENPELCEIMSEIDAIISQAHDMQYSIDVVRYHLNKTMEALVDDMYPSSKYHR